jgi:hypothetical protein
VVALTPRVSNAAMAHTGAADRRWSWMAGAVGVLALGAFTPWLLGQRGPGALSASVLTLVLGLAAWCAALALSTSRTAFGVALGAVVLLSLARLPAPLAVEYDDREALWRTDQAVRVTVAARPGQRLSTPALQVLVEARFATAQPGFGLRGSVGGRSLDWDCPFANGRRQWLLLPVPADVAALNGPVPASFGVSGDPSREEGYVLFYRSTARGGYLVELVDAADARPEAVRCRPL